MKNLGTNICENCGTPMHHLADFGTNGDDTVNTEYCHFCYQKGRFTEHGVPLEQKIDKRIKKAKKMGIPMEEATILVHENLPTLQRRKAIRQVENDG